MLMKRSAEERHVLSVGMGDNLSFWSDTDIFKPSIVDIDTSKLNWYFKLLKEYTP